MQKGIFIKIPEKHEEGFFGGPNGKGRTEASGDNVGRRTGNRPGKEKGKMPKDIIIEQGLHPHPGPPPLRKRINGKTPGAAHVAEEMIRKKARVGKDPSGIPPSDNCWVFAALASK